MQVLGGIYAGEASDRTHRAKVAGAEVLEAAVPSMCLCSEVLVVVGVTRGATICYNVEVLTRSVGAFKCYSLVFPKFPRDF